MRLDRWVLGWTFERGKVLGQDVSMMVVRGLGHPSPNYDDAVGVGVFSFFVSTEGRRCQGGRVTFVRWVRPGMGLSFRLVEMGE